MRFLTIFLLFLLIFFPLLSNVSAQDVSTYFVIDAVDSENNTLEPDLIIFINITISDLFNEQHYMTLSEFNSFTLADWNPLFYPSGTVVELTAFKDGFYDSEKFTFIITDNTPIEGLLFEHTFVLTRIGIVELPSFTENIQVFDRSFDITLSTSSQFNSINVNSKSKSLIVELDEESESGSITIDIPKSLMSGQFRVIIDDNLSEFVIEEQSDNYIITLEYSIGKHSITITSSDFYIPAVILPQLLFDEFDSDIIIEDTFIITGKLIPISTVTKVNLVLQTPSGEESFITISIFADGTFRYNQLADQLGQWTISGNFNFDNKIIESANTISFTAVDVVKESEIPSDDPPKPPEPPVPESPEPEPSSNVITSDDETPWLYYIAISLVSTIIAALTVFILYVKLILPKKSGSSKSESKLSDILSRILPKKTETTVDDKIIEEQSMTSKEEELRRKEEELKRKEEELLRKEQELEQNQEENDKEPNNNSDIK